jgi:hypothetical protein
MPDYKCNEGLKDFLLYGGIGAAVIGFILLIVSLTSQTNNNNVQVNQPNQSLLKFCKSCGKQYNPANAGQFCEECGTKI